MQSQDNAADGNEVCRPEWMMLNRLFSYCTRSLPAGGRRAGQGASPEPSMRRCSRTDCLFSVPQR